nr:hypothetical protein BaRGS_022738 [Batillaria attramentaria]
MIAVGAYLYVQKGDFLDLLPKYEDINVTAVMIAAGIIIFVVAFIGFCGAWMESQCMLIMIDEELGTQLREGLKEEKRWPTWDTIQTEPGCYQKVLDELDENFYVLGVAGIVLGVLQILLLVMTMVLICTIRRKIRV